MREILFRGKRLQGGEWVEGYFYKSDINKRKRESGCDTNKQLKELGFATLIFTPDCDTFIYVPDAYNSVMVIPDTVGKYTGLTDKNGKKIFEGDILESHYDEKYPEDCAIEEVIWKYNGWCKREYVSGAGATDVMDEDGILKYSKVIGNIHDNPELLGGTE